jgi:hypothetical protein
VEARVSVTVKTNFRYLACRPIKPLELLLS